MIDPNVIQLASRTISEVIWRKMGQELGTGWRKLEDQWFGFLLKLICPPKMVASPFVTQSLLAVQSFSYCRVFIVHATIYITCTCFAVLKNVARNVALLYIFEACANPKSSLWCRVQWTKTQWTFEGTIMFNKHSVNFVKLDFKCNKKYLKAT